MRYEQQQSSTNNRRCPREETGNAGKKKRSKPSQVGRFHAWTKPYPAILQPLLLPFYKCHPQRNCMDVTDHSTSLPATTLLHLGRVVSNQHRLRPANPHVQHTLVDGMLLDLTAVETNAATYPPNPRDTPWQMDFGSGTSPGYYSSSRFQNSCL